MITLAAIPTEILEEWRRILTQGAGIATAGAIDPDIPSIHAIGPGLMVDTAPHTVRHLGFGIFVAGEVEFCGGGAMTTLYNEDGSYLVSYTIVTGAKHDWTPALKAVEAELAMRGE